MNLRVTPDIRDNDFPLKHLDIAIKNIAQVELSAEGHVTILMKGGHRHWVKETLDQLLEKLGENDHP